MTLFARKATCVWASPAETVGEVARAMTEGGLTIMPVVQDGRTLGVVTDRDLAAAFQRSGLDIETTRVTEIMSHPAIEIEADADDEEALRTMLAHRVHSIVLRDRGRFAGVVSIADIAACLPGLDLSEAMAYLNANAPGVRAPSHPEIYIG